jgi:hypothetical protein
LQEATAEFFLRPQRRAEGVVPNSVASHEGISPCGNGNVEAGLSVRLQSGVTYIRL